MLPGTQVSSSGLLQDVDSGGGMGPRDWARGEGK